MYLQILVWSELRLYLVRVAELLDRQYDTIQVGPNGLQKGGVVLSIERLQGVWPKIISVAMEMPIFYVNFSSLNYPNLKDESLGPYG